MFNFKKNNATSQSVFSVSNNGSGDDLFSVHTMQQDLNEIKHPDKNDTGGKPIPPANTMRSSLNTSISNAKPASPFLTQYKDKMAETKPTSINRPADARILKINPSPIHPPIEKRIPGMQSPISKVPAPKSQPSQAWNAPKLKKEEFIYGDDQKNKSRASKYIFAFGILLLLLGIAAGGYYFYFSYWMPKQNSEQPVATNDSRADITIETEEPIESEPELPTAPAFSTDKANYLNIDPSIDSLAFKSELVKYASQVLTAGISKPVEFIVTDQNNNPLTFTDFAKITGMTISSSLMDNLSDNFSLFIFNDSSLPRIGLAIESRNNSALKSLMLQEESGLVKALSPIFMTSSYTPQVKTFGNSSYANLEIRYVNIDAPEQLSVDYTIKGNKLLIGTTKMTLRSIIDYISSSVINQ